MSQEHDTTRHHLVLVTGEIRTEAAPFEPGYQPETLPHISIPDLPDDAQGLSADALAQVPTLTDWVNEPPAPAPVEEVLETEPMAVIQDTATQADTWREALQVRMGRLIGDIHTLNARLDWLEEQNKAKV